MGKNSTLFYLVNNTKKNQDHVLSNQMFSENEEDQQFNDVDLALNKLEFEVRDEILEKVIDYARSIKL